MTTSKQHIKERMMQTAARFWGLPETETEASFDPLVGLLIGACATELEKINGEIENSRSRVLERLVQLLSPEALTGVLPAHAIAYAMPSEQTTTINPEDQFYSSKRVAQAKDEDQNKQNDIYFSPVGKFKLHKASIFYKAVGKKIIPTDATKMNAQIMFAESNKVLPANQLWLGIDAKSLNLDGLRFYFDIAQQSQQKTFFNQLPKAKWYAGGENIKSEAGYPKRQTTSTFFNVDAVLNRDISATEKSDNHIHAFYERQFITLQDLNNEVAKTYSSQTIPDALRSTFSEKDLAQIQASALYWLCVEFPENVHNNVLEELLVSINCFPVVNRHLNDINFRIKEFINVIPLQSEESFLDVYNIADQRGKLLHLKNETDEEDDFSILLRHGGVSRFDNREASEMVDKLIHLLREETAAFSILGNDFLQNEMTVLQQTINKLEQQIANKQLLKGNTPYLVINNKQADTRQTVYVKYWSCNGVTANIIKAGTALNVYSNSHFESGTAKLITTTQGGRDKLKDTEKVLAYKSALLSKQRLVTNEDIAAFCRLRLAMASAAIQIKKGFSVQAGETHGLVRTLDVHIVLGQTDFTALKEKATIAFWQSDIEVAILQHSNFFIPIRIFINENKAA
jgi:Type VI secretion system, TssF